MSNHPNWIRLIFFNLIITIGLYNCSDPIAIGTDLLEQDLVEVNFTDTLTLHTKTVAPRRTLSYSPPFAFGFSIETINQLSTYLFGNFEDPIFGNTLAEIYIQPEVQSTPPDFENIIIERIELVLPYDTAGFYGDLTQEFGLEIYRLTETPAIQDYFTDDTFAFDPIPIIDTTFLPSLDSVEVIEPLASQNTIDTIKYGPQLRIPLSNRLIGQELLDADPTVFQEDEAFFEYFKGFYLRPKTKNNRVISFILRGGIGGMNVYYTQRDTARVYQFGFFTDAIRSVGVSYDREGSLIGQFVDSESESDSLIFIQGAAGAMGKIEIPYINSLDVEGLVVNKAELIMNLATLPQDDTSTYRPIEQISAFQTLNDGTLEPIEDLSLVMLSQRRISSTFGGTLTAPENDGPFQYRVNVTAALQDMLDNNIKNELLVTGLSSQSRATTVLSASSILENEVVNSSFSSIERANRSVIYGANHPDFPMKLSITFSKIQ